MGNRVVPAAVSTKAPYPFFLRVIITWAVIVEVTSITNWFTTKRIIYIHIHPVNIVWPPRPLNSHYNSLHGSANVTSR